MQTYNRLFSNKNFILSSFQMRSQSVKNSMKLTRTLKMFTGIFVEIIKKEIKLKSLVLIGPIKILNL